MTSVTSLRTAGLVMADVAARIARGNTPGNVQSPAGRSVSDGRQATVGGLKLAPSEDIFSVNYVDATKAKIALMERVGKAFGLNLEDFKDMRSMAEAIRGKLALLGPDALKQTVNAIEDELGLKKLGVSLGDVLDAMEDPKGTGNARLEAALAEELGQRDKAASGPVRLDEIGRYSIR